MKIPERQNIKLPSEKGYSMLLDLQEALNNELKQRFFSLISESTDHIANDLVNFVEILVDRLKDYNYSFGRSDYSGDINYENSEQWFSDGNEIGQGIVLHFHGFSVQVSYEKD